MFSLYNTLLLPVRVGAELWYLRHRGSAERGIEAGQRLARQLPEGPRGALWVHGSSVGEARIVNGVAASVRERRPELPVVLSAFTRTGRAQLAGAPVSDATFFLPLDFAGLPGRIIEALRPALLTIVETELWPNLLDEAHGAGVPVAIVNGRLSADRMGRYRRLWRLYRPRLSRVGRVGAQSTEDAGRFVELGVPQAAVRVTGNVKYDLPVAEVDGTALRAELGLDRTRPVLVAGSTGENEEASVLEAFLLARGKLPDLFLVLAPRHPSRCDEVEQLVRSLGLTVERYSRLNGTALEQGTDLLLVDTLGQLGRLYALGDVAFVGGSLVPVGGHNVLEPAALGIPVLFGPHTQHFAEPADALLRAGGARRVADARALAGESVSLLADETERSRVARCAERVVTENRGALERSVEMLLPLLEPRTDDPRSSGV